jgi:hyperosmotically inducible protein
LLAAGVVPPSMAASAESHKSLSTVRSVAASPGVGKADNRRSVEEEVAARSSDAWLLAKVKVSLLVHGNVSALHTGVEVKNGVVTLRGDAASGAQKELTTEYVKDVNGVKEVRNEMAVSARPKSMAETLGETVDDASITAQVELALLTHRSTSAIRTRVDTDGGVVTVTGKARNAAEKDLVTKLVDDVKGVRGVKNDMTVGRSG